MNMDHIHDLWSCVTWWNVFVGFVVLYFTYDTWCHTLFWRYGIKGPFPKPVFGNMFDVSKGLQSTHMRWIKKYGRIVGAYERQAPYMLIAEPDILEKILQKDFDKFSNRRVYELKSCPFDQSLSQLTDPNEWYQTRQMMTSVFSDDSLRQMFEHMIDNCSILVKNIETSSDNQPIQIKRFFDGFSMDMIGNSAFGLQLDSFTNSDHAFTLQARNILESCVFSRPLFVASILPWIIPLLNYLNVGLFPSDAIQFFRKTVSESVQSMSQVPLALQKYNLLNGMLDAYKKNLHGDTHSLSHQNGNNNRATPTTVKDKVIPELPVGAYTDHVMAQALGFLLAGNETISTALCLTSYAIAAHSNVQDRLLQEMDQFVSKTNSITYDIVTKMEYLDMVIKESLRMYPPTVVFDRVCSETVQYDKITIPADMTVIIPVWSIHRDSRYWTNPHRFNPERFKKRIHPFTYLPFGGGPRDCIAMDFAVLQIKLAILHILRLYRLETCPETEVSCQCDEGCELFVRECSVYNTNVFVGGVYVNVYNGIVRQI